MPSQTRSSDSRRTRLSRERVLDAAVRLADAGGIDSLSMRRLAQELGVEAMSLYHHVASKEEILNSLVDMVVGEFELPSAEREWRESIRRTARSAHDVLVRHPWAANLMLSPGRVSAARLGYMDAILGTLRQAGFSADMTDHAYHALESHIMGFTLWEVGMQLPPGDKLRDLATEFLRDLPVERYPYLAEHIEQHLKPRDPEDEGEFAFGLELILDGLERLRG